MYPAILFGAQQGGRRTAARDRRSSETNNAAEVHIPINLPSRCHAAEMACLFCRRGGPGRFGIVNVERVDAYRHPPMVREDEYAPVTTSRYPAGGEMSGTICKTRLFGPAAEVPHSDCFSLPQFVEFSKSRALATMMTSALFFNKKLFPGLCRHSA